MCNLRVVRTSAIDKDEARRRSPRGQVYGNLSPTPGNGLMLGEPTRDDASSLRLLPPAPPPAGPSPPLISLLERVVVSTTAINVIELI